MSGAQLDTTQDQLVDYLANIARIRVSTETARQIPRNAGVSWPAAAVTQLGNVQTYLFAMRRGG